MSRDRKKGASIEEMLLVVDNHLSKFPHLQEVILESTDAKVISHIADKWVKVAHKVQCRFPDPPNSLAIGTIEADWLAT